MFKKILIPTDGSPIASAAAAAGIDFAKQVGAEIIGIFVAPEYQYPIYVEAIPPSYPTEDEYRITMLKTGEGYLAPVRDAAEKAGLRYAGHIVFSDATAEQIARAAQEHGCDLIFMGSHGRSGWQQLLLGSVTSRLLASCDIPVLVHRIRKNPAS
jgi:nucleotide-binding universal stress UspA family protein